MFSFFFLISIIFIFFIFIKYSCPWILTIDIVINIDINIDVFLEGDVQKDLGKSSNNLNALFKRFFFLKVELFW